MDSYRTVMAPAAGSTMPGFHLLSRTAMPQAGWQIAGQGARILAFDGCGVTDTKFSTHVGPPLCSPPV
jgi:hypothetical protein